MVESVWGIIFYVCAGVQTMMILPRSSSSKVLQNSFWRPWALLGLLGGHFVDSSSWLVWGNLFHRFGRCSNQDDFLEEFAFQGAPKVTLVTLAPFGPSGGLSL